MLKIKELFLKYKLYIFIGLATLLFSLFGMYQCNSKVAQINAIKAEMALNEIRVRNETKTYYINRENLKLDSLKSIEASKTLQAKMDALIYKSQAERLRKSSLSLEQKYNKLVLENAPCPERLDVALQQIDTLKLENKALIKTNGSNDIQIKSLISQLNMCEQQSNNKDTLLIGLKTELNAANVVIEKERKVNKADSNKSKFMKFIGGAVIAIETAIIIIKSI